MDENKNNKSFKNLFFIIGIIILIASILIIRKIIIIESIANKEKDAMQYDNYYIKSKISYEDSMMIIERYNKDGTTLENWNKYSHNNTPKYLELTFYNNGEEQIGIADDGEEKYEVQKGEKNVEFPIHFQGNFIEIFMYSLNSNITKVKLNGKKCYLIKYDNREVFVDIETGLCIKEINNDNNQTIDYTYKFDTVKDEDVVRPNI